MGLMTHGLHWKSVVYALENIDQTESRKAHLRQGIIIFYLSDVVFRCKRTYTRPIVFSPDRLLVKPTFWGEKCVANQVDGG